MNQGTYLFSQLISIISPTSFRTCVNRYNGDYKTKHFNCWRQYLCMVFGQLTHRESLSDTILCLKANSNKLYHIGIGEAIAKSTLSTANENRDWRIFSDFAGILIKEAQQLYVGEKDLELSIDNPVFAIDASTIDMCLSLFQWANFRSTKAGIKLRVQLDLRSAIPEFIQITTAAIHEVNILDTISYQIDSFYILDRGYVDFKRLYRIHFSKAFFVIRAKDNLNFRCVKSNKKNKASGILADQLIRVLGFYASKDYPDKIRRIKFYDEEHDRVLVFLTNNFELDANEIAKLYKHRWKIELFFKWIKQNLKIKTFWGTSENAVRVQIWIAISAYIIVAIAKKRFILKQSLYEILQVISVSVFDKMPIKDLFANQIQQNFKELNHNQLNIFE
ncbi:IS4 family transposase [soil metagenome]